MGRPRKEVDEAVEDSSTAPSIKDELSEIIAKNLGKEFKDSDKVVWFLNGVDESPTEVTDWVSTGSSLLDLAISNKPNAGLPVGKICEFTGLEGCVTEDTIIDVEIE